MGQGPHCFRRKFIKKGIKIQTYDPQGMKSAKSILKELILCNSAYEACRSANCVIIATEWNEFRALDLNKIKEKLKDLVIFDLRNIYNPSEFEQIGFEYHGVGK